MNFRMDKLRRFGTAALTLLLLAGCTAGKTDPGSIPPEESAVSYMDRALENPSELDPEDPLYYEYTVLCDEDYDEAHPFCAFPSLVTTDSGTVLAAYKQGWSHGDDAGASICVMEFTPNGEVLSKETVYTDPDNVAQNAEILRHPGGEIRLYIEVQDTTGKRLYVAVMERNEDGSFREIANEITDQNGVTYTYVFDGVEYGGEYYIAAMTFPEFGVGRRVNLLRRDEAEDRWVSVMNITKAAGVSVNETALEAVGDYLYITARGDKNDNSVSLCVDSDMTVVRQRMYSGIKDSLTMIGRPSLFMAGDTLYLMGRDTTYGTGNGMRLSLYAMDKINLKLTSRTDLLDEGTGDGYYAEAYFLPDEAGRQILHLVTYTCVHSNVSDIVLYRYPNLVLTQTDSE